MERRKFLKAGVAGLASAFAHSNALAWSLGNKKPYTEYDRDVCYKLNGLKDYNTGEPFTQDGFVIAYFTTPYRAYQGCVTDALNIYAQKEMAERLLDNKVDILPVLIISPLEAGDPYPSFAKSYTDEKGGNVNFIGLTGDKDTILKTAQNYRSAFEVDRHTKKVIGHNRSVVLISPDGELLTKFPPNQLDKMAKDMALEIFNYNSDDIKPARGCSFD